MASGPSAGGKRKLQQDLGSTLGSGLGSGLGSSLGSSGLGSGLGSGGSASDDDIATSDSGDSCDSGSSSGSTGPPSILRRSRALRAGKRVRFAQVTVYYFARRQGFTCVPSAGGSSLGMAPRHHRARRYSLSQFAHLRQVSHRQHLRQHLRREKLRARRRELTQNGTVPSAEAAGLTLADVSDDDLDVGQVEVGDYFYLQPLPTKRRRALLRASGVRRIDAEERQELRALRLSREQCGCLCRLTCEPRTCACSQAGIQCQVDRTSFPCGCSREGCGNVSGRIEFNPLRVRTHFLHTLMKLELENRRQEEEEEEEEGQGVTPSPTWPPQQPPETQDFQEYLAENERAVLHLQTAEELERLKAEEEDSGSGSGGEGGGICVLGEHLDGTWQVKPSQGSTLLIPTQFPLEPSVLCYPQGQVGTQVGSQVVGTQVSTQVGSQVCSQVMGTQVSTQVGLGSQVSSQVVGTQVGSQVCSPLVGTQVSSQPYLSDSPSLYCQVGPKAGSSPPGKELGVLPSPPKGGAPQNPAEHLEQPHLPV